MHSCCMFLVVYTCSGVQSMCSLFMVSAALSFSVNMGMLIFVVGLMVITLISELLIEREGRGGEGRGGRKRGREGGRKGEEVGRREGWNKLHIANNHHTKQADETLECVS